jgi:membrane protein
MAKRTARRGVPRRLLSALGALVSRDTAVLTHAIAFNFLLCLFPLLVVLSALSLRLRAGRSALGGLLLVLQELIPFEHKALQTSLLSLTRVARGLELLSLLLIVWGSSWIFIPVEMALNRTWGGGPDRSFWKSRLVAFVMTTAGGVLGLISVGLTVVARGYARGWPLAAGAAVKLCAVSATLLLFFLIYRFVPGAPVGARVALRAALWAGGAFEAAKYAFVWNLPRMNLHAFYGPLAFSVALLLWAYLSSLTLVFGALMSPLPAPRGRPG